MGVVWMTVEVVQVECKARLVMRERVLGRVVDYDDCPLLYTYLHCRSGADAALPLLTLISHSSSTMTCALLAGCAEQHGEGGAGRLR